MAFVILPATLVIGSLVLYFIFFRTYYMPTTAMAPTLQKYDVMLVSKMFYAFSEPRDGDLVLFDAPIPSKNRFFKRIVAMPGERFRIHAGQVFRNGAPIREPWIAQPTAYDFEIKAYGIFVDGQPLDATEANLPPKRVWTAPDTVPPGCYIVLGDNRNNSEDSHIFGCAQRSGPFSSGPLAGTTASDFYRATRIVFPFDRATSL